MSTKNPLLCPILPNANKTHLAHFLLHEFFMGSPTLRVSNSHGNPPCTQQLKLVTHPRSLQPTRSPAYVTSNPWGHPPTQSPTHETPNPWGHLPTQSPSCAITHPDSGLRRGHHFLLQCMKVKSESEVTQLCLTLSDPMDCSLPGSSVHGSM